MVPSAPGDGRTIWTVGHWNCAQTVVVARLLAHDIDLLVDVRAQPGSRRTPHFDQEQMPGWLGDAGIDYLHLPELAGRRRRQDVDPAVNAGWQNASFHNYADYTLTAAYEEGIMRLEGLAVGRQAAIMCGEPMPWRCHRLLVANTLAARGWTVCHLMGDGSPRPHEIGRWGATPVVGEEGRLIYPEDPSGADR